MAKKKLAKTGAKAALKKQNTGKLTEGKLTEEKLAQKRGAGTKLSKVKGKEISKKSSSKKAAKKTLERTAKKTVGKVAGKAVDKTTGKVVRSAKKAITEDVNQTESGKAKGSSSSQKRPLEKDAGAKQKGTAKKLVAEKSKVKLKVNSVDSRTDERIRVKKDLTQKTLVKKAAKSEVSPGATSLKRMVIKDDHQGALVKKWSSLLKKSESKGLKASNYNMSKSYEAQTPIQHKVLGWGYILNNVNDRLEVLFKDGIKYLISNYK